ncbi:MAG: CPBP family intramembrane metalloprotease [Clostridia bacterium]|nr:CPBP family intramembrane metalloprotease [Clostridia bacterium]
MEKEIKLKKTFTAPFLVAIVYILLTASGFIDLHDLEKSDDNIYLSVIILQMVIFLLPGIVYCKLAKPSQYPKELRIKGIGGRKTVFTISAFFVMFFGSNLLKLGLFSVEKLIRGMSPNFKSYMLYSEYVPTSSATVKNIIYIFVALSILPAVTEEFVFRGILLNEYKHAGSGIGTAMFMSSLMFAMLHFDLAQLPVYFFCGMMTAAAYYVTGSLVSAVIIHTLNNAVSMFFENNIFLLMGQSENTIFFIFMMTALFMISLMIAFGSAEKIFYKMGIMGEPTRFLREKRFKKNENGKFTEAILSPSFLLCLLIYIANITLRLLGKI